MILTDSQICRSQIIKDIDNANITNIGYDLTSDAFTNKKDDISELYELVPGDSIFVMTKESIELPNDTIGIVVLKNSRLRQGLHLDAPIYQPGHKTKVFFRITNFSKSNITLAKGDKLATIIFNQLDTPVSKPYNGTYQSEFNFKGMGTYGPEYSKQMKKIERKIDTLKEIEKSIYSNVITIMTIFIGIFSIININLNIVASEIWQPFRIIQHNLTVIGAIGFLVLLSRTILSHHSKKSWAYWLIPIICFIAAIVLAFLR